MARSIITFICIYVCLMLACLVLQMQPDFSMSPIHDVVTIHSILHVVQWGSTSVNPVLASLLFERDLGRMVAVRLQVHHLCLVDPSMLDP